MSTALSRCPATGAAEIARKCSHSFALVFIVGGLGADHAVYRLIEEQKLNGDIQKIAHSTEEKEGGETPNKGKGSSINWDDLLKVNKEIVGWIQYNGTTDEDSYGSIFLDYRCTNGTDSKNIVLHGHHMNDGSMFGNLMDYGGTEADIDFYKKHPTLSLTRRRARRRV